MYIEIAEQTLWEFALAFIMSDERHKDFKWKKGLKLWSQQLVVVNDKMEMLSILKQDKHSIQVNLNKVSLSNSLPLIITLTDFPSHHRHITACITSCETHSEQEREWVSDMSRALCKRTWWRSNWKSPAVGDNDPTIELNGRKYSIGQAGVWILSENGSHMTEVKIPWQSLCSAVSSLGITSAHFRSLVSYHGSPVSEQASIILLSSQPAGHHCLQDTRSLVINTLRNSELQSSISHLC